MKSHGSDHSLLMSMTYRILGPNSAIAHLMEI